MQHQTDRWMRNFLEAIIGSKAHVRKIGCLLLIGPRIKAVIRFVRHQKLKESVPRVAPRPIPELHADSGAGAGIDRHRP